MTPEQRLHIRAELARRMGITLEKRWQHVNDPTWCIYDIRLPGGTYLGSHCGSIEEAMTKLPNPFTNAAAKDQLLKFVADQPVKVKAAFLNLLLFAVNQANGDNDAGVRRDFALLTASPEAVTIAAAKALGIETE